VAQLGKADHDQRFKELLREFFREFLLLFFPEWVDRVDFTRLEWLDKEVYPDPPRGERRVLDLVAKLPTRQVVPGQRSGEADSWIALLHMEVESADSVAPFRSRMYEYREHLRWKHNLPVLSIALYLRVGLDGVGWDVYEEYFWEKKVLWFTYPYVGLPALDAEQYVQGNNWLGVALSALMRVPEERKIQLKADALRRLRDCPENDQKRYLLWECVDAYLPLQGSQLQEFENLLDTEPYQGVKKMAMTYFERGVAKGLEEGLEKGQREGLEKGQRKTLQIQLEERFGPLTPAVLQRLESWPAGRLAELTRAVLKAQSLQELGLEQ
jgi:hypothetical protein